LLSFSRLANSCPSPDILYCGMRIRNISSGKLQIHTPDKEMWRFVLSGCWAMKRKIFEDIGGYDVRFKFGENNELFMRFFKEHRSSARTMEINFTYNASGYGGSTNSQNIIESSVLLLSKHIDFFKRERELAGIYNRIAATNYLKIGKKSLARYFYLEAVKNNPWDLKSLFRFLQTFLL